MSPIFSVVIPAYNQAEFLDETLQSILNQTLQDFEILVVDDASPDNTAEVLSRYSDPRIIALTHLVNRGLPAARNTGMDVSRGEFIALLDADDYFHPRKLEEHLRFFREHPEISITYNARFELHHSSTKIRDIYRPPESVGLKDFVLGFPFSPSDMVIRREAAASIHFFDENMRCGGEDLDFPCRLALEGYRFARVEGILNYRRFHSGRKRKKLRCRIGDYTRALDRLFQDPRCPVDVIAMRKQAYASHYLEVSCWALAQGETELANEIIQEILLADPAFASGVSSKLSNALLNFSIRDDSVDHEKMLQAMFACLPPSMAISAEGMTELVARGYLIKGTRSALWEDDKLASVYFEQASLRQARVDDKFRAQLAAQLTNYEAGLGMRSTEEKTARLFPYLERIAGKKCVGQVRGLLAVNRAFARYRTGQYNLVLHEVARAVAADPGYLSNRGVLSIAARSLVKGAAHK